MDKDLEKRKENFLSDMLAYLMNGGIVYSENKFCDETMDYIKFKRTEEEALLILEDKDKIKEIDVLKDELDYFGLELSDVI